ncbi:MAG: PD-(D/E)XK nuclease family protein [Actinomycetes bacterium]
MDYLNLLDDAVRAFRQSDPTAPVTVLVSTQQQANELRTTLARSDSPRLHIGVTVATIMRVASAVAPPADPYRLNELIRLHAGSGFFAPLTGLPGVVDALAAAFELWDQALPSQRAELIDAGPTPSDHARLEGIDVLHARVVQDAAEVGATVPSVVLSHPMSNGDEQLWIDSTVCLPTPMEAQWLERLAAQATVLRIEPAIASGWKGAELISAVDPVDEASLAARRVSAGLESGIAARDIAIVVPGAELARYTSLLGMGLEAVGVPHDGGSSAGSRASATPVGRLCTAVLSAIDDVNDPGDLSFDHIRRVIQAGRFADAEGNPITTARLRHVWHALRGTDPRGWAGSAADCADQAAATAVNQVAVALSVVTSATGRAPAWNDLAAALAAIFPSSSSSQADAVARTQVRALYDRWAARGGTAGWEEARDELAAELRSSTAGHSEGVRVVPLSAGWAMAPELAIVVGLSDDLVPGAQSAVGPLTADEVICLRAVPADRRRLAEQDARLLAAVRAMSKQTVMSFARSDLLRTIVREPSRHLKGATVRAYGSIEAQQTSAANGDLGLLGSADAAALQLRCGIDVDELAPLMKRNVGAALRCTDSRLDPPARGLVDDFNGDLRNLEPQERAQLSPDTRSDGTQNASPSALEKLLGCPIGWWAARVVKVDEPGQWDPLEMDAATRGTWLHQAIFLLSQRQTILVDPPSREDIEQALWDAIGGRPDSRRAVGQDAEDDLLGFRYRVDPARLWQEARTIDSMIQRLQAFTTDLGGSVDSDSETVLEPRPLDLPTGPLFVGGRVDRIDELPAERIVVTDYKTGRAGSGFQLAVYAWLRLLDVDGRAQLLYASGWAGQYQAQTLGEPDPPDWYDRQTLESYLFDQLAQRVQANLDGVFPSLAWSDSHDAYCPVCNDVVPAQSRYGSQKQGYRALAVGAALALEEEGGI